MSGTVAGGKQAAITNKSQYGSDYYQRIGAIGGKLGRTGGFHARPDLAVEAGRKGGTISRRGPAHKTVENERAEFREGFNKASWGGKLKNKLKEIR